MLKTWRYLKENYDTLLTIVIGAVVAVLSLVGVAPAIVSSATLGLLALIAVSLLRNKRTDDQLQQTLEATNNELQQTLAKMHKPTASQVFARYKDVTSEIDERLSLAREVWVLGRTCTRMWEDYNAQFTKVLNAGGKLRFMLVDPKDGALKMISGSAEHWDFRRSGIETLRAQVENFLAHLAGLQSQHKIGPDSLQVRVLDFLPAWTLLLIDPNSDKAVVFIELATYRADPRNRPAFSVTPERDGQLYQMLMAEYETMWDQAVAPDDLQTAPNRPA